MVKRAALALLATLAGVGAAVAQLRDDPAVPVRLLAVLRANESASSSSSCVAIMIAPSVLLAQAQCVAALDAKALQFAEFGVFHDTDAPCDGCGANDDVVVGSPSSRDGDAFVGDTSELPAPWTGDALDSPEVARSLAASTTAVNISRAFDGDEDARPWVDGGSGSDALPPIISVGEPLDDPPVEHQRVAIRAIKFHPNFAFPPTDAATTGFVEHDFAVIELEREFDGTNPALLVDNTVPAALRSLDALRIGVLHVDADSLSYKWIVGDVLNDIGDACGFDATSPRFEDTVCATSPRMPWTAHDMPLATKSTSDSAGSSSISTANASSSLSAQSKIWSFLFYTMAQRRSKVSLLGFAARSAPAALAQMYAWPASSFVFISRTTTDADAPARWVPEVEDDKMIVPGDEVEWLPLHLGFVAGLRAQKASANFCGGSLVGSSFVLTAAHCVDGTNKPAFVSIGSLDASGVADGEQIRVIRVIKHPQYNSLDHTNDLALLELAARSFYPSVPIFDNPQPPPRTGTIFGYGAKATASGEDVPSNELRFMALDIIARNAECEQLLQQPIHPSMFCAGGGPSKDACVGDSGGPLVLTSPVREKYVALIGVISYGRGRCGIGGYPGVYANVSSAAAFLRAHVPDVKWTTEQVDDPFPVMVGAGAFLPEPTDSETPTTLRSPLYASRPPKPLTTPPSTSGGGSGERNEDRSASSSQRPGGVGTYQLEVPATLAPHVRDALGAFLVGDTERVDASRARDLVRHARLVLRSTQRLDRIEAILATHSAKALNQRSNRFRRSSTPAPTARATASTAQSHCMG